MFTLPRHGTYSQSYLLYLKQMLCFRECWAYAATFVLSLTLDVISLGLRNHSTLALTQWGSNMQEQSEESTGIWQIVVRTAGHSVKCYEGGSVLEDCCTLQEEGWNAAQQLEPHYWMERRCSWYTVILYKQLLRNISNMLSPRHKLL